MKRFLLLTAILAGTFFVAIAQNGGGKFSAGTRLILAGRDGKFSVEKGKQEMQQLQRNRRAQQSLTLFADEAATDDYNAALPSATPFVRNGVKMAQCWISMSDDNYAPIEALGVEILAKFNGKVTANIPVDALEKLAALKNVTKISAAKNLKKKTYRSRVLTNVDDVHSLSADAQTAGLIQSYDGTGVVLGIIDTGIDFGHQMFKNSAGQSRIKKKYVYNTTSEQLEEYSGTSVYFKDETHGTHTSTIAGGSDYQATAYVYTTGTSYTTVSNAKFGGMAPGADLVLCDLGEELTDANISACIKNISDYADQVGKPCVISLSLGGHFGPHDGTGDMADVCDQYTGKGKIILFASGNEGEDGIYLGKNASASSPAMTVLTSGTRSSYSVDYGAMISYARTPDTELAVRYYVVNTSTNRVLWTSNEITTDDYFVDDDGNIELYGAEISVNDTGSDGSTKLSTYFTAYQSDSDNYGYLCCYMDKDAHNNKWNVETVIYYLKAVSSNYKIGISIYPKTGSCYVDSWPLAYIDFTASSATVNGNTFTAGNNESSASDEASFPSVISVGAYCSSKYWRAGTTSASNQYWTTNGTYQQISMFSSYQAEGAGPTGQKQPWITAPGEVILAGYNSGYSAESNIYYAYGTNKVLGAMSGTSMATPCAAGITALWLQAKPTLTPDEVKEVMQQTAIKDTYVTGTYASHFGQGKIDALAGIKYILENDDEPRIAATPLTVDIAAKPNETATQTVNVKGKNLTGNITATLSDVGGVFAIDKTSIANTSAGADITISYTPTAEGNHAATITLSSAGADDVTVTVNGVSLDGGTASDAWLDIAKYATIGEAGWSTSYVNNLYEYTEYESDAVAWLTLPVYGAWVGTYYNSHPQKWISSNVTSTSNKYAGTTWNSSDKLLGSSPYFTSTSARAMGYNSRTNYTQETVSFYVTNTTAVKLLGLGQSRSSSTYPATLNIYECSAKADGTLTEGTTAVKSYSNSATSGTFVLSATDLDAEKVYKVVAATYRSLICEIGFQTPLTVEKTPEVSATPTSISVEAPVGSTAVETLAVTGKNLEGSIALTLSDEAGVFAIDKNSLETSGSINVTFTPKAAQTYQASLTIESEGAESVSVSLEGTGLQPFIMADPEELSFAEIEAESTETLTVNVVGENLCEAVTATLSDANGVFSLDATSLSMDEVTAEEGKQLAVTFAPQAAGTYTGSVTLSSPNAESVVIGLSATAKRKTPDYYDATISSVGLSTMYLDFPVEIPYDAYDPDLLGVYIIYDMSDRSELKLARLNTTIPANTGVIIQGNSGTYRFPKATGNVSELKRNNYLQGVVETTPVSTIKAAQPSQGTIYTLGKGTDSYIGFYKYSGKNINANRCYLFIDNNAAANGFSLDFDDMTTAIDQLRAGEEQGEWVTLQGIRLNGKPAQRGIYIHNGKTVNIK